MNYGIDCQVDPMTGEPLYHKISAPVFLLMQDDYPIDFGDSPVTLAFNYVDLQADFYVACGVINEFGQKEIIAVVGAYHYRPLAKRWRCETSRGKANKLVSIHTIQDSPRNLLRDALYAIRRQGWLSDVANLGKVTITAEV